MKAQAKKITQAPALPARIDVFDRVTASIVAALEQGVRPWLKPWSQVGGAAASGLPLRANGTPYRGINVLPLWAAAADAGYTADTWATYKQAAERGGQVRKGERGSMVVLPTASPRPKPMKTARTRSGKFRF